MDGHPTNVTFELNDYAEDGKIELRFTQSRIRRNLCKPNVTHKRLTDLTSPQISLDRCRYRTRTDGATELVFSWRSRP